MPWHLHAVHPNLAALSRVTCAPVDPAHHLASAAYAETTHRRPSLCIHADLPDSWRHLRNRVVATAMRARRLYDKLAPSPGGETAGV